MAFGPEGLEGTIDLAAFTDVCVVKNARIVRGSDVEDDASTGLYSTRLSFTPEANSAARQNDCVAGPVDPNVPNPTVFRLDESAEALVSMSVQKGSPHGDLTSH